MKFRNEVLLISFGVCLLLFFLPLRFAVAWPLVLLMPFWFGPLVVWRTVSQPGIAQLALIPDVASLPGRIQKTVRAAAAELERLGFVERGLVRQSNLPRMDAFVQLFEHPQDGGICTQLIVTSRAELPLVLSEAIVFGQRLVGGGWIWTSNQRTSDVFSPNPRHDVIRLPAIRDAAALYRAHQRHVRQSPGEPSRASVEEPVRFQQELEAEAKAHWVRSGDFWFDDRRDRFRMTFVGAWRLTYRALPPFRQIREAKARRRGALISQ